MSAEFIRRTLRGLRRNPMNDIGPFLTLNMFRITQLDGAAGDINLIFMGDANFTYAEIQMHISY